MSAPSAFSVSISTAVWIVMCSEPAMRAPVERLRGAIFGPRRHQARHFRFGDVDFLAAPGGKPQIGDGEIGGRMGHRTLLESGAGSSRSARARQ